MSPHRSQNDGTPKENRKAVGSSRAPRQRDFAEICTRRSSTPSESTYEHWRSRLTPYGRLSVDHHIRRFHVDVRELEGLSDDELKTLFFQGGLARRVKEAPR